MAKNIEEGAEKYTLFIKSLSLENILLEETKAVRKPAFDYPVQIKIDRKFGIASYPKQDDQKRFSHVIKANHILTAQSKGSKGFVFKIQATYVLFYSSEIEIKDAEDPIFEKFTSSSLTPHVWPYFREHVQGIISKMGLPQLTLDVIVV